MTRSQPKHPIVEDVSMRPGAVLTAPGKELTFLSAPAGRLRFREDVGPDAMPVPMHRHMRQTERFTAIDGRLQMVVDKREVLLDPGESAVVLPGIAHTYAPADGHPVLIEVELWPVKDGGRMFETIYGLSREYRLPPRSIGDALALAAFIHAYAFYLAALPLVVQRPLAGLGAAIAALLRIEPWAPRFAARSLAPPPLAPCDLVSDRRGAP